MRKAAPVTTLCGQLAALKNTNLPCENKKRGRKSESLACVDAAVNKVDSQRGNTCVLPNFLAGQESPITAGGHIWWDCIFNVAPTAVTERSLTHTGNCRVSHK